MSTPAAVSRRLEWPGLRDPRWPFAALLLGYCVLGVTALGFNRTSSQMATVIGVGCLLDLVLCRVLRGRWVVPLSALITCCSLALLLNYSHSSPLLLWPVLLAIGSKYVLTFEGRHVFNPSMFGVATSLLFSGGLITAAPAYQWAGGAWGMSAFVVMAALVLFVFRIGRGWLVVSFLLLYAAQTGLRAWIMRHHIPPAMLFWGTVAAPPFFIFVFYMLTDPATSARTRRGQVIFSVVFVLVDLVLHARQSVFTLFYTALAMATVRFGFLHIRALVRQGPARLRALGALSVRRATGAVGAAAAVLAAVTWGPAALGHGSPPPTWRYEAIDAAQSGLGSSPGDVLTAVDPRLLHVAKWILSVGDAVAVGDFDRDGLPDVFLTHTLKAAGDRAMLYRNRGDFRFERVALPALEDLRTGYRDHGLPGGATFVDSDGDGDLDLAIAVAFGPSRLLRNQLVETGRPTFEDVTLAAGLGFHTISLALAFFDQDHDGHLDMLVANSLTTHLPDYDTPTPLNIFRLPPPAWAGDRRALRFMHNGWHNADNGGLNVLLRGQADGTFRALSPAESGLAETRWSLAVATVDLDHDGWTDLYIANDFGPDEVYLNHPGQPLTPLRGNAFGEVGRDTYKGMNASVADFDGNGYLDVHVSNVHQPLQAEGNLLWMVYPTADGVTLRDEATARGALNEQRFGWGAATGDVNGDGWPDLVQANGMVDDRLDRVFDTPQDYWYVNHKLMQSGPEVHTYADMWGDIRGRVIFPNEARRVYVNRGDGTFVDEAVALGVAGADNSRGVALADFDNDGDLDLLITNQHGPVSLLRSTLRQGSAPPGFVGLTLVGNGQTTHRQAVGSRVEVRFEYAGQTVRQVQEVGLLTGFGAQGDGRLHFGLGAYTGAVEVTIHWLGGEVQTLRLAPNQYHEVHQAPAGALAGPGGAR